ncbi:MAG: AMP-dependent synthetase/ligase [Promethearchaeota archaeon]
MKVKEEWFEYPSNLVDIFEDSVAKFGDRNWIGLKNPEGVYEWTTYQRASERVDNLRAGLAKLGIVKDDPIGLIINNSPEWAIIAFATFGLGARLVPMYEKELEKVWRYIIEDSAIKILFVVDQGVYDKVKGYIDEIETLEKIVLIRGDGDLTMASIEKMGKENPKPSIKPHWSDIAKLIYTSGTTGDPKGVLLSHGNLTTNVLAANKAFKHVDENTVTFGILPWGHSFGSTAELYHGTYIGGSIGLMDTIDNLLEDIVKVKPTVLVAVPRIFNKVYAGVHNLMEEEGGIKLKLFNMAKEAAVKARETGKKGFKLKLLDKIVFAKVRAKFGGRLEYAVTGSAVMNPDIAQFMIDLGIPTFDCYGLSETSPAMTMNTPAHNKLGTVGTAIEKVTVVIDKSRVGDDSDDGEIICFGPNVAQGYHNKPEKTAEVFFEDPKFGWGMRTGDRGRLDEDGFLYITGRFKEEYKLENGKYVHPASVEEDMKLNPYVTNAFIYGDGRPYNVCIIEPDFEVWEKYAEENNIESRDPDSLVKNADVTDFVSKEITNQLKGNFGGYEIPKKFMYITEEFSLDNGLLTQTMKLKRRNVLTKFGDEIEALYKK